MDKKIIIGLTGQYGAGKSTIAKIFAQHKFCVIDADRVAKEITSKKSTALLLADHFGTDILNEDDYLNRKALADIVFSDREQLKKLNSIMFPKICKQIREVIDENNDKNVVIDAPQLFESGLNEICDIVISVIAPIEILVQRIVRRDNISEDDARLRLASQHDEQFFIERSDYIIRSDSTLDFLNNQVMNIIIKETKKSDTFNF